jgi:predicted HTH transcriptional regulator
VSDFDDLIRDELENTTLDFKRTQYLKPQYEAFLKDVLSMANAHALGDRHIVCGISLAPGDERMLHGVPRDEMIDAATYQQLVAENIERELQLEYVAHETDGLLFGIVRITGCTERPYAMKKEFGPLLQGHLLDSYRDAPAPDVAARPREDLRRPASGRAVRWPTRDAARAEARHPQGRRRQ